MLPDAKIVANALQLNHDSEVDMIEALNDLYAGRACALKSNSIQDDEKSIKYLSHFFVFCTKQITIELLQSKDEYAPKYLNNDLVHASVCYLSEIMTTLISTFSISFLQQNSWFIQCCGPSLVMLNLTFKNDFLWSCSEKENNIKELLKVMLPIFKKSTLEEYLLSMKKSTYNKTILLFTSNLKSDRWKKHIPIVYAYQTLINLSNRHQLSESLSQILPPVLLFVDDFQPKYIIVGLVLLQRLLHSVPSAEFRMYGWADVIQDALQKKIYQRDAIVLDHTLPCLLLILKVLERDPKKYDKNRTLTKFDDSLQIIISSMTMSTENDILRIHWKHLDSFLDAMGITILRHLKDLLELLEYHLDVGNEKNLQYIFQAIQTIICIAWIRFKPHTARLLKLLLKLALRLNINKSSNESKHYKGIQRCVFLLYKCHEVLVKETLDQLKQLPEWNETHLREVINVEDADQS